MQPPWPKKEERKNDCTIRKTLLGYDPLKWIKGDAEIRDEGQLEVDYQKLETIAPSRGTHRFAHCQVLYEEVHAFIRERKWAPAQIDTEVVGTTWVELFALFDVAGSRSIEGQRQKNPAATTRAEKRRQKARDSRNKKVNVNETTVVIKPTLGEQLKVFKAIVRHITKIEAEQ